MLTLLPPAWCVPDWQACALGAGLLLNAWVMHVGQLLRWGYCLPRHPRPLYC